MCCRWIYSSTNYHGKDGVEAHLEKQLSGYDGGSLIIRDQAGNIKRVIIEKDKKDGEDVLLQ